MIKVRGVYSSKDGSLLDAGTSICGGASVAVLAEALGDFIARITHHVMAVYGEKLNVDDFLDNAYDAADETLLMLPDIDEANHQSAKQMNDEPESEPEYKSAPSHREEQTLICSIELRADGFEVAREKMIIPAVSFGYLPEVAAGLVGALGGFVLACATNPVDMTADGAFAAKAFISGFKNSAQEAIMLREVRRVTAFRKRLVEVIRGDCDRDN